MKIFLISSPFFSGDAKITFREDGTLVKIDTTACNMDSSLTASFKKRCPEHYDLLQQAFHGTQATIVAGDFDVTFEMFWLAYDHKFNKKRTEPVWNKLSKVKQVKAYYGIKAYDRYLRKESWCKKAHPDTYLTNEMWENEYK